MTDRGTFCSVPGITRVWINRPNVQKPREEQGKHPVYNVLLPDGTEKLVWGVQWQGLTISRHELDHPVMGKRAVAWIETTANVWLDEIGPAKRPDLEDAGPTLAQAVGLG